MGLIDKNKDFPKFDTLIRTRKEGALLAHIYATYLINDKTQTRKENIALKLVEMYNIFKGDAGTYCGNLKQYSSQYTIGHDMGIWEDSDLHLSEYALKVVNNEITVKEYISRVFVNLFTYVNDEYTHILYNICDYMLYKNKSIINSDDIILSFSDNIHAEFREHANSILQYLIATNFFTPEKDNNIQLVNNYTAQKIKDLCNLEYKNIDGSVVRNKFKDKKEYSSYIAQPINYNHSIKFKEKSKKRNDTVQKLIYGPPGTGKSYSITDEIRESYPNFDLTIDNPFVFRTTFHPEYTYNDFIGQVMPVVKDETIIYDFTPGIFTQALQRSISNSQNDVYLVLEEMSRANVAAIFGDIFQLLDRVDGISEYTINNDLISKEIYKKSKKIFLPSNLHIIGTVNTSDQNVYVMDTAFKRRFDLDYMDLDPQVDKNNVLLNNYKMIFENSSGKIFESDWIEFYQRFNEFIVSSLGLSEDKQLGHFFVKFTEDNDKNKKSLYSKLLQYIWQDIHLISFSKNSLFRKNFDSFSKVYKEFKQSLENNQPIAVFSDDFVQTFDNSQGESSIDGL